MRNHPLFHGRCTPVKQQPSLHLAVTRLYCDLSAILSAVTKASYLHKAAKVFRMLMSFVCR